MNPFRVILGTAATCLLITGGLASRIGIQTSNRGTSVQKSQKLALDFLTGAEHESLIGPWQTLCNAKSKLSDRSKEWTTLSSMIAKDNELVSILGSKSISDAESARESINKLKKYISENRATAEKTANNVYDELHQKIEDSDRSLRSVISSSKQWSSLSLNDLIVSGSDSIISIGSDNNKQELKLTWIPDGTRAGGYWATAEISVKGWRALIAPLPSNHPAEPPYKVPLKSDAAYQEDARRIVRQRWEKLPNGGASFDSSYKQNNPSILKAVEAEVLKLKDSDRGNTVGSALTKFPKDVIKLDKDDVSKFFSKLKETDKNLKPDWSFRLPLEGELDAIRVIGLDDPNISEWVNPDAPKAIGTNWKGELTNPPSPGTVGFRIVLAKKPAP